MTIAQIHALLPLLTQIGAILKVYLPPDDVDADHSSPAVYLTTRQWRRILEEFGTE